MPVCTMFQYRRNLAKSRLRTKGVFFNPLGIFNSLQHFILFPLLDHASAAFKNSFHFLWCQRALSAEYFQSLLPVHDIPFGVADTRAGGSRTAKAATTIFHAWVVNVPLKRRDTARDALDLIFDGNFLHGLLPLAKRYHEPPSFLSRRRKSCISASL